MIRSVVTHPRVYRRMTDDFCREPEAYRPCTGIPAIQYIAVWDSGQLMGIFVLVSQTGVCIEIHAAFLPEAWGQAAKDAMRGILDWIWTNTNASRVIGAVPKCNPLAIAFGKSAGMTEFGVDENSFQKWGKLWGRVMLGITRPGIESCQYR